VTPGMSADEAILIVGAGIAGLAAAHFAKERFPHTPVLVVEQAADLGGLLGRFDYGSRGIFDRGMHWYTETAISAVDELFLGLLPSNQWHVLEGSKRDLSGLYYRGRLQTYSQYPDLRFLAPEQYRACLADFFCNLQHSPPEEAQSETLQEFSRRQFGPVITDTVVAPIAERVHGAPAGELDVLARSLPLLDRVILFDEQPFRELMNSELLRARIAFPEQRRLPLNFSSGRRSYYPKTYGIHRIIDALADRLRPAGVEIMTAARVANLKRDGHTLTSALIERGDEKRSVALKSLIWSGSPFPLAALLGLLFDGGPVAARRTIIVSALLKSAPRTDDLYCFFCADGPHSTYRVTNFAAFCPNAVRGGVYPISIELLLDTSPPSAPQPDYATQALKEIEAFGIVDGPQDVQFAKAELLPGGFPAATRQNVLNMDRVRTALEAEKLANLVRIGILAEPRLFFQHDVLCDAYGKIEAL
jgi:protoporphyrinogen oxidase